MNKPRTGAEGEKLWREEIHRRATNEFFGAMDHMATVEGAPVTEEEIQIEMGLSGGVIGDRPQFFTGAEHYWRATLTDLVEAELRRGNRGLSSVFWLIPNPAVNRLTGHVQAAQSCSYQAANGTHLR